MNDSHPALKPSPAELAELEHAFATDPSGEAYHDLAEAYLSLGRTMEAMVVCKKGMRALPTAAAPRLLLARIQVAQNRPQRALEELQAALSLEPDHLLALRMAAELRLELGEREEGEKLLRRAAEVDPADLAVAELARAHGISAGAPEPSPAPAPAPTKAAPKKVEKAPAAAPAPTGRQAQASAPRAAHSPVILDPNAWDDDEEPSLPRSAKDFRRLLATAAALLVALGGWFGWSHWQGARERQIADLVLTVGDLVRKDTYLSYKEATEAGDRVLSMDGGHGEAHAYLAYVSTLRWGEQGEGEDFHRRAAEHLERGKREDPDHPRLLAAEALLRFFEGDPAKAQRLLEGAVEKGPKAGAGLLLQTLGRIQMESGELERAAATLKDAQGYNFNSVRLLSTLGRLHWRRGMEAEAWAFYDSALRLDGDHADSLLGKALLILDSEAERKEEDRQKLLAEASSQIEKVLAFPNGALSTRQLARAKFAMGLLLLAQGKEEEGKRLEQEALALDSRSSDLLILRGRRHLREGNEGAAVRDIQQAIRIEPRLAAYADLGKALRGRPQDLVAAMEDATKTFASSGRAWILLGDARRAAGMADEARAAYEKAIAVEGGKMPDARVRIARLLRSQARHAQAREAVDAAFAELGRAPTGSPAAAAFTELGRIQEEGEKDPVRAFESYAKAIAVWENHAPAWYFLGRISAGQSSSEQRRQAVDALETYLRLEPRGELAQDARRLLASLR